VAHSANMRQCMNLMEDPLDERKIIRRVMLYFRCDSEAIEVEQDGTVNVSSNCVAHQEMARFPVKFGRIEGTFIADRCNLATLAGSPKHVNGIFSVNGNFLSTLAGGPEYVGEDFFCDKNHLTDLKGAPNVTDNFSCEDNPLVSLEGLPVNSEMIHVTYQKNLGLLRLVGVKAAAVVVSHELHEVDAILEKYMGQGPDLRSRILQCQKELISAGYAGNARM
jgi:hypothetical protein